MANRPTYQRRGYALEEPMEAFLARDDHKRMKGGAVSGAGNGFWNLYFTL